MEDKIYVKAHFDIGYYTGADDIFLEYEIGTSDKFIENEVETFFYEHCDDYSHLISSGFDEVFENEWEKEWENAIEQCSWSWVKISQEEYLDNI